jgi:hypothetical protein
MNSSPNDYKYDVAFSLCEKDIEYAQKICAQLNPGIKSFLFTNNQHDLISKSGPTAFAKIFKEEARIIVILSRKEWGETYYTNLEQSAILDRISQIGEGNKSIMVIPIVPKQLPYWYPSTNIYADPQRFTDEEIARFIEFKITEAGGIVKQITLKDRQQHLLKRIEEKKKATQLQFSQEALKEIESEMRRIYDIIKNKSEFLQHSSLGQFGHFLNPPFPNINSFFTLENFRLEITTTKPNEIYQRIVSTQDYNLNILLSVHETQSDAAQMSPEYVKILEAHIYKFLFDGSINGWAQHQSLTNLTKTEKEVLFSCRIPETIIVTHDYYDLKNPINAETLIDEWFQKLLIVASHRIEKHL